MDDQEAEKFPKNFNLIAKIREIEVGYINTAYKQASGNKSIAAEILGINRTTLVEKMRKHGFKLREPCRPKSKEQEE